MEMPRSRRGTGCRTGCLAASGFIAYISVSRRTGCCRPARHCNSAAPVSAVRTGSRDARPAPWVHGEADCTVGERGLWWLNKDTMLAAMQSARVFYHARAGRDVSGCGAVGALVLQLTISVCCNILCTEATPATRRPRILSSGAAQAFTRASGPASAPATPAVGRSAAGFAVALKPPRRKRWALVWADIPVALVNVHRTECPRRSGAAPVWRIILAALASWRFIICAARYLPAAVP